VSHLDGTAKASLGGSVGPFSLDDLADFCRSKGVDRLEVTSAEFGVVMVMGEPLVVPAEPPRPRTPEEEALTARRAHLKRILGREPTAHEMDVLP